MYWYSKNVTDIGLQLYSLKSKIEAEINNVILQAKILFPYAKIISICMKDNKVSIDGLGIDFEDFMQKNVSVDTYLSKKK